MSTAKTEKPLIWLKGEVKTPPFSREGRIEAGYLLRLLQRGELLGLPHSRPMPIVGPRCHELRINDSVGTFRILCRVDPTAVIILAVFSKKTAQTPRSVISACRHRLHEYDRLTEGEEGAR